MEVKTTRTFTRRRRRWHRIKSSTILFPSWPLSKFTLAFTTTTPCSFFHHHHHQNDFSIIQKSREYFSPCKGYATTTSRWLHNSNDDVYSSISDNAISNDDKENEQDDDTIYYSPNTPLVEQHNRRLDKGDGSSSRTISSSSIGNSMNEYSFFDEAIIYVRAGSGGQGANSYTTTTGSLQQQGPPDGGNGGHGGSVILQVDSSLNTLAGLSYTANRPNAFGGSGRAAAAASDGNSRSFRPKSFRAEKGMDGASRFRSGRNGKNIIIRVPPGTIVQEIIIQDNNDNDDEDKEILLDMGTLTNQPPLVKKTMIVAHGGQGGEGTGALLVKQGSASSAATSRGGKRQQRGGPSRRRRQSATGGERRILKLTLQIVADVALVGVPNAGKSTFLAAVTRAKPKIASYAFTTVVPNLGVWIPPPESAEQSTFSSSMTIVGNDDNDNDLNAGDGDDGDGDSGTAAGLVLCDVPGLIAGAADGVGLGHAFLRHVERCHVMVHLIDATSHDPIADYLMLNREIVRYNGTSTSSSSTSLANMPQVVVVNKVDVFDNQKDKNDGNTMEKSRSVQEDWEEGLTVRWSREELQEQLQAVMPHSRLLWISAKDRTGVDSVMTRLAAFVQKVKQAKQQQQQQQQ